jgi:hypothetical protein
MGMGKKKRRRTKNERRQSSAQDGGRSSTCTFLFSTSLPLSSLFRAQP